jgi:glutamate-1-semialdehyde 2,1-aminomutase
MDPNAMPYELNLGSDLANLSFPFPETSGSISKKYESDFDTHHGQSRGGGIAASPRLLDAQRGPGLAPADEARQRIKVIRSMTEYRFDRSLEFYNEARRYLAGGVSSHFRSLGRPHPLFFTEGSGVTVRDVDGNEYLDFTLSQGPMLVGHSHPDVLDRVEREQRRGQLYAAQSVLEIELGRRLTELIPGADLVRFCTSGSEAVHIALRVARAVTGRRRIIRFEGHYHGWYDNVFVNARAAADAPAGWEPALQSGGQSPTALEEVLLLPWNDLDTVRKALERESDIAAVITEPIMCNTGCILPRSGFLQGLRELCDRAGALLIFDEIITGFRLRPGGAQEYFGVRADLATFGKAMASGFPISALAGRREYMGYIGDGRVIHAGTMNAGVPCLAAALATLDVLTRDGSAAYARIDELGLRLAEGIRERAAHHGLPLLVQGPGPMFHTGFTHLPAVTDFRECASYRAAPLDQFVYGLLQRGVRVIGRGLWYISAAHALSHIDSALRAVDDILSEMRRAESQAAGSTR